MGQLIILIGASGSGKTAVAELLEKRSPWAGHTHYFDSIGVPSAEEMESYGGGEAWQRWATEEWIRRIAILDSPVELLEGQTRPSFLQPELANHPSLDPTIILLDCSPAVRRYRLEELRERAELANPTMENWAVYLRGQADALGLPVIDTSDLILDEVAAAVESAVGIGNLTGDNLLQGPLRGSPFGEEESMDSEVRPLDGDRKGTLELEMSGLRDEMETLRHRMSGTIGGGLAITALFVVAGAFMEKGGTLWFLGVMWLFITLRLVIINRASGRELRLKEAALESLANPPQDVALPDGP